jgi:sec-independent protein translocase protein TatA
MILQIGQVFFLIFGLGPGELLVVGIVALIVFGSRLPEVARSLGKGVVEFRKGLRDIEEDIQREPSSKPSQELNYTANDSVPSPPLKNSTVSSHSSEPL